MLDDDNPDYVSTIQAAGKREMFYCATVHKFSKTVDDYIIAKCSDPMPKHKAEALAVSWAAALGVEVR